MKYYTWKLKWENNEGTNPSYVINNEVTRIEPVFANGDITDPDTLIYCNLISGEFDPSEFSEWSVTEITAEDMLDAAVLIDSDATMNENGIVVFTPRPEIEVSE